MTKIPNAIEFISGNGLIETLIFKFNVKLGKGELADLIPVLANLQLLANHQVCNVLRQNALVYFADKGAGAFKSLQTECQQPLDQLIFDLLKIVPLSSFAP